MKTNSKIQVSSKVRVAATKEQITLIKTQLVGSRLVYAALDYANMHYNTLFGRCLKGKAIKKEQLTKVIEFCEEIKQAKAAA